MSKIGEAAIILNPISGTIEPKVKRKVIGRIARGLGWKGKLYSTTKTKTAAYCAEMAVKDGAKHIIICGGDGSVMEVLPIVVLNSLTMGIVPLGTGNLLARNMGLPLDVVEAVKVALQGKVLKIDVGNANGIYFAVMAGVGLDALIMRRTSSQEKRKYGFLAYFKTALSYLHTTSRYQVRIDRGKERSYKAKTILVANLGEVQGGLEVVPATHSQNGKFRIGIVKPRSWIEWLDVLYHALTKTVHKSRHYILKSGREVEITPLRGKKPFECDGNDFPPVDRLRITILPQALALKAQE